MSVLNTRQYQRDRIYKQIYGDLYKSNKMEIIKQSFEIGSSKLKYKGQSMVQFGGAADVDHSQYDEAGDGEGDDNVELKFRIRDTFKDS